MAYVYNNWIQSIGQARLTALRLHITEVAAQMSAAMGAGGTSYNPAPLQQYLDTLMLKEEKLTNALGGQPFFLATRRRF